jgi:3-oxoacyl-[acyl-carrier protein] reductase
MSDRYQSLTTTPVGQVLVKSLGLPNPPRLERYRAGEPLVDGIVGIAGEGRLAEPVSAQLGSLDIITSRAPSAEQRYKGLVFDASSLTDPAALGALQEFFTPLLRSLLPCARVVVLGTPPETVEGVAAVTQRAIEGFTRSLGKEVGRGSTVQLVYVAAGAERALASTLGFLLSPKSAYVSGQVIRVGTTGAVPPGDVVDRVQPLSGAVALVTGAARGIGASIARVLQRDGASIVGLDVPQAASDLQRLMTELSGEPIMLDITAKDAPQRIAARLRELHSGVDVVVHNAGITRDKKLANMTADRWNATIAVNLVAPQRITDELVEQDLVRTNGRIIGVASIAGIAGNLGQTNYATSKAGVIGLVRTLAPRLSERGITANAVAPGFIETQMTAKMPLVLREAGRRMNSMSQGGLPVDVAETVAWLAHPGSGAVNGNVVRVCGQSLVGA